jgi:hypothetical protein
MDVQADQAGLGSDPYGTVASRPGTGQGRLFSESVDKVTSFADTDQLPVVPRDRSRSPGGSTRGLRIAVILVAVAVVAAGAALGLVKAGVIGSTSPSTSASSTKTTATHHHPAAAHPTKGPLVTQTGTGAASASYSVPVAAYEVTVTTTTGRSWVSIGVVGQHPAFAGILNADSSQHEILLGPSTVDVGAGGTSVTITSGKRSSTLKPLAAPFTYQFTPSH